MGFFLELVGAIGLLLWGLRLVRTGIMRAYGPGLNRLAREAEGRMVPAFFSGLIVAILLQSSTATAMIVASFSSQGILSAGSAFVIILGADVGTALAVFLASQKVLWLSPALVAVGVFGFRMFEDAKKQNLMRAILGLGLILLALMMIGKVAANLSHLKDFNTIMKIVVSQPFMLVVFGVMLAYFAHSSLAVVLLAVGFVQSGFFSTDSGLYLVLGANIGSGLLPMIANWKSTRNARIPVTANLLVRLSGVILAFPLIGIVIAETSNWLTPAIMPAVMHLLLNLVVAMLGLVFFKFILKIASAILPAEIVGPEEFQPKYLDEAVLSSPNAALTCAKREALRMADIAQSMVRQALPVIEPGNEQMRRKIIEHDDTVDRLFNAIKIYIAKIMRQTLSEEESQRAIDILSFTANMEHIGDIVDVSLMELADKKAKRKARFSKEGFKEIETLHQAVCATFELAINTFVSGDPELAHLLYNEKANVRMLELKSVTTHLGRISTGIADSLETSSIHLDIIRDLKRINSHLTSIAYPVLKASGEVPKTKWYRQTQ